ncbi:hypothetical protein F8388_020974 [Cannabis sativa]|uniref:LOB domain-containing protein n=1 Tax=Cannabis sativa TaxID=3483 RepID=A0A7J6FKT8_CANSA|nr:hypothetical protein F8388_020974 [Cannabis sativa]
MAPSALSSSRPWKKSSMKTPCAACKILRRKCKRAECPFAPYFPSHQLQKFFDVHKVFGASNVSKILNSVLPSQREDTANSLAYEAAMRLQYPVYGCLGIITLLQHQVNCLTAELSDYQNRHHLIMARLAAFNAPTRAHNHRYENLGINAISGAASSGAAPEQMINYGNTSSLVAAMNGGIGQLSHFEQPWAAAKDDHRTIN